MRRRFNRNKLYVVIVNEGNNDDDVAKVFFIFFWEDLKEFL